jgi:hypothetical protein
MKTILGHKFSAKGTNNMLKRSKVEFFRSLHQVLSFIRDNFYPQMIETTITKV